jgi:hypothetical protein
VQQDWHDDVGFEFQVSQQLRVFWIVCDNQDLGIANFGPEFATARVQHVTNAEPRIRVG